MKNDKVELAKRLHRAVSEAMGDVIPVGIVEVEDGIYCDYWMERPVTPELFARIGQNLQADPPECLYELTGFSGLQSKEERPGKMLQRIEAAVFETQQARDAYNERVLRATERDHRKIGRQLQLFSFSEEIGAGLVLWHPKGAMLRYLVLQFGQKAHMRNGYRWLCTPHIGKAQLWETSGHLDFFRDSMYAPLGVDGEEYYLKPMNCPFHIGIYNSTLHSYRELPLRYAEYGTVYRYELSGALSGLTRVRGFTQDDAHILCTPEQVGDEVARALKFSLYVLRSFGLTVFKAYISTKPKGKAIGGDADWAAATEVLMEAVRREGLSYEIDEGGGAFYGPKIDVKLYDALGRAWQCSTVQFDSNLPARFGMTYTGPDGKAHTPYMVHRALFGSIERFIALLIEHYGGDFPLWLAPVQLAVLPIAERHNAYCKKLERMLAGMDFRAEASYEDMNLREKIKRCEQQKVPLMLVVGDREAERGGFALRSRKSGDLGFMTAEQLREFTRQELAAGEPEALFED